MRSIRLSLIVYFATLATTALAAVSWLVYHTTAETLEERRLSAETLIREQGEVRANESRKVLDDQLLRRARMLAARASSVVVHNQELLQVCGALGAAVTPEGYLPLSLWVLQLDWRRQLPPYFETLIASPEELIPELMEGGTDYFQSFQSFQGFRRFGQPLQRSASLGEHWLALDPAAREAKLLEEHFDDVELSPGTHVRRVTMLVPKQARFSWFPPRRSSGPRRDPQTPARSSSQGPTPAYFIQYASDTASLDEQLADIRRERDLQLAQVEAETQENLRRLRVSLFWIAGVTLTALWIGGFLLIQLGMAPLARLADAVSRVSAQDFRLGIKSDDLPSELQPIADRLAQTLGQLGQAFEREKQAAADISHELRTPLASLMTTVEVALRKARTPEEYRDILEECRLSGAHMAHLVERLLALARLDAGAVPYRPSQVDVADLAVQCADLVRPLARAKGLALRVDAAAAVPLQTDPDKVREVLTNLLHNAIEYNRTGGSIDLAVRRVNGHIELAVADTGIGIAPDAQAHIFERFYRADPSRHADVPHAGLGLAIVKSYVDLMSGRITVESGSAGSTFRVELPC